MGSSSVRQQRRPQEQRRQQRQLQSGGPSSSQTTNILFQLLQGQSGETFASSRTGWDQQTPVCDWQGIICDGSNNVIEINVANGNLQGTIPSELGLLTTLLDVYLGSNEFNGPFPPEIAALPALKTLDLSFNQLQGSLPTLASSELERLLLAHNQFSGHLPPDYVNDEKTNLKVLDLKYNRLIGTIPSFPPKPFLTDLDFSNNQFIGAIPTFLGSLTNMVRLYLSNNRLSGTIPASLSNSNLTDLEEIYLHGNELTGTLPASLADLPSLNVLFIDENKISGTVPRELCELNLNEIFFHDGSGGPPDVDSTYTDLYGSQGAGRHLGNDHRHRRRRRNRLLQRIGDPTNERDGCTSIACPSGYKSRGANNKDGVFPCEPCQQASLNPYIGANECFELNEAIILDTFFQATNGPQWTGGQSWADSSVSVCDRRGVTCNTRGQVTSIVLRGLGLSGTLPRNLGFLSRLQVLDVSRNDIGGQLPADLHFAPLQTLDVSENRITGFVPPALCRKDGINDNGLEGIYTCDTIACRAGYHSSTGRADAGFAGEKCRLCVASTDAFIGTVDCEEASSSTEAITPFGIAGEIALGVFGITVVCILYWVYRRSAVSNTYIHERAYDIHGPGAEELKGQGEADFMSPDEDDPVETDPLGGIDGLGTSITTMEVKVKPEWNKDRESSKEVWLDVPKIQ